MELSDTLIDKWEGQHRDRNQKSVEKMFGMPYTEYFMLDEDEQQELMRIYRIESRMNISYDEFLQINILDQIKLLKKYHIDEEMRSVSISDKMDEKFKEDNLSESKGIKKLLKR